MKEMQMKQALLNKRFVEFRDLKLNAVAYGEGKYTYLSNYIENIYRKPLTTPNLVELLNSYYYKIDE